MRGGAERSYCPSCESEREIAKTVVWQRDICRTCGTGVPSTHEADAPSELSSQIAQPTRQYCQYCGTERETVATVGWQDDHCQVCQNGLTKTPTTEEAPPSAACAGASATASPSSGRE